MRDGIQGILANARVARNEGRIDDALQGYRQAADLAREHHDRTWLAHALRHVSDVAREAGQAEAALSAGTEAVAILRANPDAPRLDLANALRVTALAWQSLDQAANAPPLWREARELYAAGQVSAGVEECENNLSDWPGPGR